MPADFDTIATPDSVNCWASLFMNQSGSPPSPPPLYRITAMVVICLFCTINVTVGLLDVYFVCQWNVDNLVLLTFLMVAVTVIVLVYGVTAVFKLFFQGWMTAPLPPGSSKMPWKLLVSGFPNIGWSVAIFLIYWGLMIGRIFWQSGGVPKSDAYTSFLRASNCA